MILILNGDAEEVKQEGASDEEAVTATSERRRMKNRNQFYKEKSFTCESCE